MRRGEVEYSKLQHDVLPRVDKARAIGYIGRELKRKGTDKYKLRPQMEEMGQRAWGKPRVTAVGRWELMVH